MADFDSDSTLPLRNWSSLKETLRQPPGLWLAADSRLLKIVDMSDGHILNSIRYLVRKAYWYALDMYSASDMDEAWAEFTRVYENEQATPLFCAETIFSPKFQELVKEADKRGINWRSGLPADQVETEAQQKVVDEKSRAYWKARMEAEYAEERVKRDAEIMNDAFGIDGQV